MKNFSTFQAAWETFAESVIHPSASPAQYDDMKMAFYGGATALAVLFESSPEDDEEADQYIQNIREELNAYASNIDAEVPVEKTFTATVYETVQP